MSDMESYASYFSAGMKIGVSIPMAADAGLFNDWARIHEVDEDLVVMQLSRDHLPEGVLLDVGQLIELKGGSDETGYNCRAIVVSEGEDRELLVRLIGEIVTAELREFYRIDVFLPVKYYISAEQRPKELENDWLARREKRLADELLRKQQRWESRLATVNADLPQERHLEQPEHGQGQDLDQSWDTIVPLAANISGGGIRIIAHHEFTIGQYVLLEILMPVPRRIVDAVVRVVFINRNPAVAGDRESYNVALKFVFIDERDRDAIVNHIAALQLQRLRQMREHYATRTAVDFTGEADEALQSRAQLTARRLLSGLFFFLIVFILFYYFNDYVSHRPKGEIEQIFDNSVRRYQELRLK